ncbi:MAG TPA: cupin domain-containing protein [Gammaproteobacteria bacterium]|nr:cupin domain-containing protein [Gammaproteobacteria bacterium]
MKDKSQNIVITAESVPARIKPSLYPEPFASRMKGRQKHPLGEFFGIKNFGVNLTRLRAGAESALLHRHSLQEEFIYIISGDPILVTETEEIQLHPGMCAGFVSRGVAHQLVNRTADEVVYLEVGDRSVGDVVTYPSDDLAATMDSSGQWHFTHKDGKAY